MPLGDVWEFTIIGNLAGQPVHNVFNYETTGLTGPDVTATDFAVAWQAGLLQTDFLLIMPNAYTLQAYRAQRLYNGDLGELNTLPPAQTLINQIGQVGTSPQSAMTTVIVSYNTLLGPDEEFFSGHKLLSAGNETTQEDGQVDGALITALNTFFDELILTLDLGSGKLVKWGVWSLLNAQLVAPTVILPVGSVNIKLNTGALQRRKQGSSVGGFQP